MAYKEPIMKNPYHVSSKEVSSYKNYFESKLKGQNGAGIKGFRGDLIQRGEGKKGIKADLQQNGLIEAEKNLNENDVQEGEGWGDWLKLAGKVGKKALLALSDSTSDAIKNKETNFLESLKRNGKLQLRSIASDVADRATEFAATGKGKRRRSKRIKNNTDLAKLLALTKKTKRRSRRKTKVPNFLKGGKLF